MVKPEYIDQLVGIQGFSVKTLYFPGDPEAANPELIIVLERNETRFRCPCGADYTTYYDGDERLVRDLSFGRYARVTLVFWQVRVRCGQCGVKTEALDWVEPRVSYTKRLAAAVALACQELRSLKAIAAQFQLNWHTVKDIDKKALQRELPRVGETDATQLAVDEFSLRRGHRYATTVANAGTDEPVVLYVGQDRTQASLEAFYQAMGQTRCEQVEAVAMDMWAPYEAATRKHCPQADIVYDPFHVIKNYGEKVVDAVRRAEYRAADAQHREVLKGVRYLLLKNRRNLRPDKDEPARLRELLRLNHKLNVIYVLKDDLKLLWRYRREGWARRWFEHWYRRAIHTKIQPLKRFARSLKERLDGLLAHCRYALNTGFLEGLNNKIKVIKRIAFGFRDTEYFFLKMRGACRGNPL